MQYQECGGGPGPIPPQEIKPGDLGEGAFQVRHHPSRPALMIEAVRFSKVLRMREGRQLIHPRRDISAISQVDVPQRSDCTDPAHTHALLIALQKHLLQRKSALSARPCA